MPWTWREGWLRHYPFWFIFHHQILDLIEFLGRLQSQLAVDYKLGLTGSDVILSTYNPDRLAWAFLGSPGVAASAPRNVTIPGASLYKISEIGVDPCGSYVPAKIILDELRQINYSTCTLNGAFWYVVLEGFSRTEFVRWGVRAFNRFFSILVTISKINQGFEQLTLNKSSFFQLSAARRSLNLASAASKKASSLLAVFVSILLGNSCNFSSLAWRKKRAKGQDEYKGGLWRVRYTWCPRNVSTLCELVSQQNSTKYLVWYDWCCNFAGRIPFTRLSLRYR